MAELILFGGEKGGCGKSMVCKTAIEYHREQSLDFVCFGTDRNNPNIYWEYSNILDFCSNTISEGERYEDTANAIFNAATEKRVLVNLTPQVFIGIKTWF